MLSIFIIYIEKSSHQIGENMSTKTKRYGIMAALSLLLLVAAQCGVATDTSTRPGAAPTEKSVAPTEEMVEPAEVEEPISSIEPEAKPEEHDEADDHAEEHEEDHSEEAEHDHDEEHAMEIMVLEPIDLGGAEKLQIVATTNIIGDMIHTVAGDRVDLNILIPTGSDPHTFQPTPQDAASIADAHVVVANGLNYEAFLEELISNAGGEAVVIHVAEGVETRAFEGEDEHDDEQEHDEAGQHHHQAGADPHAWMTPHNALVYVHNIEAALSALDPANAETYAANAGAYEAQLDTLDQWVFAQIETIPPENREMVTDHEAFGYYAGRYGLDIIGAVIPSYTTAAEPSAQELARLEETIAEFSAPAIFIGTGLNSTLAEQVAADTGTKLVPLYTESLGLPGSGVETYIDFIRYNTMAIAEGLTP
jgi:ABC-type Zn uptake system ZnuABC Zn-binding protein ZnuA